MNTYANPVTLRKPAGPPRSIIHSSNGPDSGNTEGNNNFSIELRLDCDIQRYSSTNLSVGVRVLRLRPLILHLDQTNLGNPPILAYPVKPLGIMAPGAGLFLALKSRAISIMGTQWTFSWVFTHSIKRSLCHRF